MSSAKAVGPDWAAIARRAIAEDFGEQEHASEPKPAEDILPPIVYVAQDLQWALVLERILTALGAEASMDVGLRGFPATLTVNLAALHSPSDHGLVRELLRANAHIVRPVKGSRTPSQSVRLSAYEAARSARPARQARAT